MSNSFVTPVDCTHQSPLSIGLICPMSMEWVAISSSKDLPDPGIEHIPPALAGGFFTAEPPGKPLSSLTSANYSLIDKGIPGGTSGKELACQCRRWKRCGFDPWVRKIPWRRARQPTPKYSCLENLRDIGAWWAIVHRVTQSQTQVKWLNTHRVGEALLFLWSNILYLYFHCYISFVI